MTSDLTQLLFAGECFLVVNDNAVFLVVSEIAVELITQRSNSLLHCTVIMVSYRLGHCLVIMVSHVVNSLTYDPRLTAVQLFSDFQQHCLCLLHLHQFAQQIPPSN